MAIAKSIGWAIYAAGIVIWLFGYLSAGHASAFDWDVATPSWIASFFPNLEAELGLLRSRIIPLGLRRLWRWRDDNYNVLEDGVVVGRIFLSPAAMAAFAKFWRRD